MQSLACQLGVEELIRWYPDCTDDEMLEMYQQCDLFILANRQVGSDVEGFGMVLLEAAACGKPTIAGRSGGTREAIVDGQTGCLVDADDSNAIANQVVELLNNAENRTRLGNAGRLRAESNFDWPILASKVERELGLA